MYLPNLVHNHQYTAENQKIYNQAARETSPRKEMAATLVHNTYSQMPSTYHYTYTPQPPPSPPVEEATKCSLPSISSLLVYADHGSPNTPENAPEKPQPQPVRGRHTPDVRYGQRHSHQQYSQTAVNSARVVLPPTPPMRPDSVFGSAHSPSSTSDGIHSPPTILNHSAVSTPGHYYSSHTISNVEALQSLPAFSPIPQKRHSMPLVASLSYMTSPIQYPSGPYYQPQSQTPNPAPGMYYQRPLPQNFPPSVPVSVMPSASNPWQHHHYISPSSQAAFPQSQDRYICQTCSKAFSRPSSLRIHSHSHTGEKPFKCPHHGCGKAFSVRSNMKRHERGCHSSPPSSI